MPLQRSSLNPEIPTSGSCRSADSGEALGCRQSATASCTTSANFRVNVAIMSGRLCVVDEWYEENQDTREKSPGEICTCFEENASNRLRSLQAIHC